MKRQILLIFLVALVATVPAGATKVNVKYADADYGSWKTWAFADNPEQDAALEKAGRTEIRERVKAAIAERLEAQGYEQAEDGKADFRVAIDGTMSDVFDVQDIHRQISNHVAFVMEGGTNSYREGTLMIRLIDAENDRAVWTGWITERVDNPKKMESKVGKAVKRILRKFPPED